MTSLIVPRAQLGSEHGVSGPVQCVVLAEQHVIDADGDAALVAACRDTYMTIQ